ncbi:MAG TPA: ABC transporter ATP-binding protein, partial [Pirellulaceae bacterium]|nr:ABC transporter ATP-binding protein [Pirellulaceae bacterium]
FPGMSWLALHGVTKEFPGGVRAVDDLSLEVGRGELLALVGPSGCGKTTVLRLLAGLEVPTRGEVRFGLQNGTTWAPWARNLALVGDGGELFPRRTVAENLVWSRRARERRRRGCWSRDRHDASVAAGLGDRQGGFEAGGSVRDGGSRSDEGFQIDEARSAEQLASWLQIDEHLNRCVDELSAGQQQRVALGRALLARPAALLLDEPLARIDGPLRGELIRDLRRVLRDLRMTAVYVTHDRREAASLGDRVAVLAAGRLQQVGSWGELQARPATESVARWLAEGRMNFASAVDERGVQRRAAVRADDLRIKHVGDDEPAAGVVESLERVDGAVYVWLRQDDAADGGCRPPDGWRWDRSQDGRTRIIGRSEGEQVVGPGDRARVTWDWSHALWFERAPLVGEAKGNT